MRRPKIVTNLSTMEKAWRYEEIAQRVEALGAPPAGHPTGAMKWLGDVATATVDVLTRKST